MIRDGLTRLEARVAQAAERPMTSGVDPSL
jgi:hypothetical protein